MKPKHTYYALLASIVILFGLSVAGIVLGNKLFKKEGAKLLELKTENQVVASQEVSLEKAKKDVASYTELESIAKTVVPQEKDQARTVREIVSLAQEAGVGLATIQFPDSKLGEAPKKTTSVDGKTTTTVPAADPDSSQLLALKDIPGVYTLEISVDSAATAPVKYEQVLDFLSKLEQNRRTAHVTKLTIQPSADDRKLVTFSLTLNAYIKL
jgi:hypothetical protein